MLKEMFSSSLVLKLPNLLPYLYVPVEIHAQVIRQIVSLTQPVLARTISGLGKSPATVDFRKGVRKPIIRTIYPCNDPNEAI